MLSINCYDKWASSAEMPNCGLITWLLARQTFITLQFLSWPLQSVPGLCWHFLWGVEHSQTQLHTVFMPEIENAVPFEWEDGWDPESPSTSSASQIWGCVGQETFLTSGVSLSWRWTGSRFGFNIQCLANMRLCGTRNFHSIRCLIKLKMDRFQIRVQHPVPH
jgi:hypothetical protein